MRIGVWGDSITHGALDPEGLGWVGRMRKALFTEYEDVSVYNRGISGDTSRGLRTRFPIELESIRPEIAVISIGINDTVYRDDRQDTDVPLEEFTENLAYLIGHAKAHAGSMYVVGLTNVVDELLQPFPWSSSGKCYANAVISRFDTALEGICRDMDVPFISVYGLLPETELVDGLHPGAAGYERMARHIQGKIALP